jgi:hypothetical protein
MKRAIINGWKSFLKLFRFLVWYAIVVAAIIYVLPYAGHFLEGQYEAMNGVAKFIAILGIFCIIGIWQVLSMRERMRGSGPGERAG